MGAFTTKKILYGNVSKITHAAEQIRQSFAAEGYEVHIKNPSKGDEIYITKGGLFKSALGLRSALKITMRPTKDGNILKSKPLIFCPLKTLSKNVQKTQTKKPYLLLSIGRRGKFALCMKYQKRAVSEFMANYPCIVRT